MIFYSNMYLRRQRLILSHYYYFGIGNISLIIWNYTKRDVDPIQEKSIWSHKQFIKSYNHLLPLPESWPREISSSNLGHASFGSLTRPLRLKCYLLYAKVIFNKVSKLGEVQVHNFTKLQLLHVILPQTHTLWEIKYCKKLKQQTSRWNILYSQPVRN